MPLVLSRKKNETIQIGDSITITVTRLGTEGVRLAIDAPKGVRILRGELVIDREEVAQRKQLPAHLECQLNRAETVCSMASGMGEVYEAACRHRVAVIKEVSLLRKPNDWERECLRRDEEKRTAAKYKKANEEILPLRFKAKDDTE
jgi:carbon storage regulator